MEEVIKYTKDVDEFYEIARRKREKYIVIAGIFFATIIILLLSLVGYFAWLMQKNETVNDNLIKQLNQVLDQQRIVQKNDCTLGSNERRKRQTNLEAIYHELVKNDDECDTETCAKCFERSIVSNDSKMNEMLKKRSCPICYTKDCTQTAAYFVHSMDTTVDPCKDFYQFTCGNFIRKYLVPEGQQSFNLLDLLYGDIILQNKALLENIIKSSKAKVMEKMQNIYHVCMNVFVSPEKEVEALKTFAVNILDWPMASGKLWKPKFRNLNDFLIHLETIGFANPVFQFGFADNRRDKTIKDISMLAINLATFLNLTKLTGEDRQYAETSEKKELNLIKKLLAAFGNADKVAIQQDINDMIRLTDAIEELEAQDASKPKLESDYMSMEQLYQEMNDKIDWLKIFNNRVKKPENQYNMTSKVFMNYLRNFRRYTRLIQSFPPRVIMNAVGWKAILNDPIYHAGPIVDKILEEYIKAGGQSLEQPLQIRQDSLSRMAPSSRYYYCSQLLNVYYPLAMTRLYVDEYIDRSNKKSANELLDLIAKSYRKIISKSQWLDEETKTVALRKADKISKHVGYPEFIFDDAELDKEYAYMPEAKSTHFDNIMTFRVISATIQYITLPERTDGWPTANPTVVNAHYVSEENSIWFPAVTLRIPFFDNTRPAAVNFGMMGTTIGHEIGHAFDNDGKSYDEDGKPLEWWTEKTEQIFNNKSSCLSDQFSQYCPEELQGGEENICVNGYSTVGENLADNTGVRASFEAYQMWVKKHGEEKRLPGLENYTPEQLFFISYAYFYCENLPTANWEEKAQEDVHAPGKYRVLGTLSNSRHFRKAFNCPKGPMNRGEDSCTIW